MSVSLRSWTTCAGVEDLDKTRIFNAAGEDAPPGVDVLGPDVWCGNLPPEQRREFPKQLSNIQCAWLLLAFCAAPRAQHVPPADILPCARGHDDAVWAAVEGLLGDQGRGEGRLGCCSPGRFFAAEPGRPRSLSSRAGITGSILGGVGRCAPGVVPTIFRRSSPASARARGRTGSALPRRDGGPRTQPTAMSAFRATVQGREGQGQPKAAPDGDVHQSAEAYVHVAEHESQQTCVAAANRHGELVLRTKRLLNDESRRHTPSTRAYRPCVPMNAFKPCASAKKVGKRVADPVPTNADKKASRPYTSVKGGQQLSAPTDHASHRSDRSVAGRRSSSATCSRREVPNPSATAGRGRGCAPPSTSTVSALALAQALKPALSPQDPPPSRQDCASTSFFSPASTSEPTSPMSVPRACASDSSAMKDELAALRIRFEARESELLQEVAELRGALATARIAQAAAEASVIQLRGDRSEPTAEANMSKSVNGIDQHSSEELSQLQNQISLLEQKIADSEIENDRKLTEQGVMLEQQLSSQQHNFRSECEQIWRALANANIAVQAATDSGHMQNVSPRQDAGSRVVAVLHTQASLAQVAGAAMAGVRLTLPSRRVLSPTPNCSARSKNRIEAAVPTLHMYSGSRPTPRPSEEFGPRQKLWTLWAGRRNLEALDLAVALVLLLLEVICWLVERWTGCVAGWHLYHRIVSHLLFKLFFHEVIVDDPHRVLKMAGNQRLIFCSNHPTGLLDRLLIQYLSPRTCFCLTQNWFSYTNHVEMCLHVAQGLPFTRMIECLDHGHALWIAVGGSRELNPYIRKVHTGAARIALQAARHSEYEVLLVPLHLCFEAHCQFNSAVLVELGKPVHVEHGVDPDSVSGRERVRGLVAALKANLLPLTNWIPTKPDADYGKKGSRGVGQTRLAVSEWYLIRVIDTLVCLHALSTSSCPIPWRARVQRVRAVSQHLSDQPSEKFQQARNAFQEFADAVPEGVLFRVATGTYWDMPVALKAIPRRNPSAVPGLTLAALRNFSHGPLRFAERPADLRDLPASCTCRLADLRQEALQFIDSVLASVQWEVEADARQIIALLEPSRPCPQVTSRDSPRLHPVQSIAAVASSALSTGSVQLLTANSRAAASPVPMRATVGTFTARSVSPQRTAWSMSLPLGPHAPSVRAASPGSRAQSPPSVVQPVQCVMRAPVQTVQPANAPGPRQPAVGIAFPGAALPPSHQRLSPRVASLSPSRTSHAAPLQCPHVGHGASKPGPVIPVVRHMDTMSVRRNLGHPKAPSHPCATGPTQTSQTASGSPVASAVEISRGSDRQAQQATVCSPVRTCVLLDGSRRSSPTRVQEACANSTQGSPVLLGTPKLSAKHPEASSRGTPVRIVGGPPMQGACCKTELAETARAAARATASPIIQPDLQSETRTPSGSLQSLPAVSGSCKLIGQAASCPDPFLSTGPSAAPLSPMARTPDPPGDGRNGSWSGLDSRQSLTSSFLGNDNSSPPHFGSAKILHTSSNKHRTLSPGAACVVLPPSPEIAPRGVGPVSSDVQGTAGESHIKATLFELFRAPISEPHVAEEVGKEMARQAETLWDDLVILPPVRSLASAVARSISSSGQAKDEPLWTEHLGDEEPYQGWWRCVLARYGLSGSGDAISPAEVTDLAVAACRMLRDHFAPPKYLRNLRTVRSGAKRVQDRYDNFRHLSSSTFAKHYRCRSRLSFEDRLCSQTRKSQLACPADQLRVEVEVLRSLQHPHLPRVVESFEDFNDIYIISEIVDNVRLLHFMQMRLDMRTGISEGWLAQVFKQILETLSYCHQLKPHGIVHGDIGLETVGLASVSDAACAPHVVISGLGVAGTLPSPSLRSTSRLSGRLSRSSQPVADLIAPRSDVEELCSPKHDVWCCGCLLYLLLTGHVPGDAFFGETFRPKVSSPDWALVRHASAQAEALCSRMLESDPARRPAATDCLCYPWLQSGSKFCFKMVPLSVLEKIIQIDQQNQECKEVVGDVVAELSMRSVSCASTAFANLAMPSQSWGDPLESVQLTPFLSAAPLLQLGISVPNVEKVMRAFAVPSSGLIAHGSFVKRCLELAEDQLDRSLWRLFVAAREDESGVLPTSQLEEVLHGDVSEVSATGGKDAAGESCAREYIRSAMDPELTASEAVRQIASGNEVTFELLKEFVMQRHNAACAAAAKQSGHASPEHDAGNLGGDGHNCSDSVQRRVN
eukprot:s1977_g1.t2